MFARSKQSRENLGKLCCQGRHNKVHDLFARIMTVSYGSYFADEKPTGTDDDDDAGVNRKVHLSE